MLGNPSHHLRARAQLPLTHGGLGLRSAFSTRHTAYWASWADTLPALHRRSPGVTSRILHLLQGEARSRPPSILEANQAAHILRDAGFAVPAWDTLPTSGPPNPHAREAGEYQRGWQRLASSAADNNASAALLSDLDPRRAHFCCPKPGPTRAEPSPYALQALRSPSPVNTSAFSCGAVCASPSLSQTRLAGAGAPWMSLVTTAVHAPPLASCAPAPCPLNARSLAYAAKPAAECTPTSPSTR